MWYNVGLPIWTDPKKMKKSKLSEYENNFVFQKVFYDLLQDALHRYDIEGLPDTISKRVVLQSLLWNGTCYFFNKGGAWLALPGMPDGAGINLNGDFAGAYVYGANGFNKKIDLVIPGADNSRLLAKTNSGMTYKEGSGVMVRETEQMFPFINTVTYYAACIADTMRTLDVCRKNAKRPYIITCEESVVNSVREYFNKRDNNEDYIISSGVFPADKIKIDPLQNNPDFTHSASELIDWYTEKFREECGIDGIGPQIDKKGENLISDEVHANDQYVSTKIDNILTSLNTGFNILNQISGLSVKAVPRATDTAEGQKKGEEGDDGRLQDVK